MPASSSDARRLKSSRSKRARPTRTGIVDQAERIFAERGYAATPLRDLISGCGCSTTAFYARFDSKEAVLEALIRRLIDDLTAAAGEALPRAKSLEDGYRLGIAVLESKLRGKRGLWRIVLTEGAHTAQTRPLVRKAYATLAALLAAQLEHAARRGRLPASDVEPLAWALVATISMHLTRWAVFEELSHRQLSEALAATARTLLPPR